LKIIDFTEGALASRMQAADDLERTKAQALCGSPLIIDLGDNLAMTSWVDGYLVPVARRSEHLIIVTRSELTRSHLRRVFASRKVRATVAQTRSDALAGRVEQIPAA